MIETCQFHQVLHFMTENTTVTDLRGHVLYDTVEKVKTLMVIGLGGNKLLENSEQARLRRENETRMSICVKNKAKEV